MKLNHDALHGKFIKTTNAHIVATSQFGPETTSQKHENSSKNEVITKQYDLNEKPIRVRDILNDYKNYRMFRAEFLWGLSSLKSFVENAMKKYPKTIGA